MLIFRGYHEWIEQPQRKKSGEVDYGVWWRLHGRRREPTWRVSWLQDTGELYAVCPRDDTFTVLDTFETREQVERALHGWADPDSPIYCNLTALATRLYAIE